MFIDPPTHSRSKRMEDDFDVQRDHVTLLMLAADCWYRRASSCSQITTRVSGSIGALGAFAVEDIDRNTLPGISVAVRAFISAIVLVDPAKIVIPPRIIHDSPEGARTCPISERTNGHRHAFNAYFVRDLPRLD